MDNLSRSVFLIIMVAGNAPFSSAGFNRVYLIPGDISNCSPNRIREIDGAVIRSSPSRLTSNSACLLKFESDDDMFTSKRLMINFETLNFSTCDATLKIYFHRSTSSRSPDHTFTCNSPKPSIIYSPGKYVTFRLDTLTDRGFDFNIILTSYKETTFCREFRCGNGKCIEDKLRCDGFNHCGDNSDELRCSGVRSRPRGRLGLGSSLASAFSSIFVILLCVVFCVVCFRRRRAMAQQGEVLQQQHTMVHTGVQPGVPPPGMNQPPPPPPIGGGVYPMGPPGGYQGVPTYNPGVYPPPPPGGAPVQPPPPYGYAPPPGPGYYPPPPNMYPPPPPGGNPGYPPPGNMPYPPPGGPPPPGQVYPPPPPGGNPGYPPPGNMPYPPPGGPPPPGQGIVTYNANADQIKMP